MIATREYLTETVLILGGLDLKKIDEIAGHLEELRDRKGRLFLIGVGGSAATASHAVNDFRKFCGIEASCPTDNAAELTARTNDEGWHATFTGWLDASNAGDGDLLFVLSVGGGSSGVSENIMRAVIMAKRVGMVVVGVVGRDGGATAEYAHTTLIIPPMFIDRITPHTEEIASVVLHLLATQLCSQ